MTTTMEKSNANERFASFAWRSRERFLVGNRAKNCSAVATGEEGGDVENGGAETKKKRENEETFASRAKNKWAQTAAEAILTRRRC